MTREYPPEVYGGAGVHVTELVAQLRHLCEVDVHCMGAPARRARSPTSPTRAAGRQRGAVDAVGGSGDGQRRLGGHRRALAHLVHRHGRAPGRAAVRHPPRADRALARAAAAVEGRAARRRLPGVVVGGAHRGRGRRRGHRGQLRHARGRAAHLPDAGPEPRARGAQRHRHRASGIRPGPDARGSVLAELGVDPARPIVAFVGRITRQKGVAHLVAAAHQFAPDVQLVLCAGAPGHPGDRRRGRTAAVQELAGAPHRRVLGAGDAARSGRFAKYFRRQRFSSARRCTSRWAS